MATRYSSRLVKPLAYAAAAGAAGGAVLYISYRPRNIPGSAGAVVPTPTADDGTFMPPRFPRVKTREEQILDLKRSGSSAKKGSLARKAKESHGAVEEEPGDPAPYDLLIIGGGATGSGIALDAATRGLKVALVEKDDFAAGTSSKSTKLVHGGVRYLEKAVWELDYNQYKLVKEALRERKYFLDTAPHLSMWLPIMLPINIGGRRHTSGAARNSMTSWLDRKGLKRHTS